MSDEDKLNLSGNKAWHSAIANLSEVKLEKLKELNLSHCDILELPTELCAMSQLEKLNLSFNGNLQFFSASACVGLKRLKVLNLSYCDIRELPEELSAMSNLESLDLSENKNSVDLFPTLGGAVLSKLQVLKLHNCNIQELPAELSAMSSLESLDLSGNEKLRAFPSSVCVDLKKVKVLKLDYCDIRELPAELSAMSNLESLDLSGNKKLKFFPPSACGGLETLKVLSLKYCDKLELPAELSTMSSLEELHLTRIKMPHSFLPLACKSLSKLKVMNLAYCKVEKLPVELIAMKSLEKLTLSGIRVPHSFLVLICESLTQLTELNMSGCNIQELPEELSAMCDLEELDLSNNNMLKSFPASACVGLSKLKFLEMHHCNIQELPAELSEMKSLESLDLSYNKQLQPLPTSVYMGLNKLRVLILRGCDIQKLPEYDTSKLSVTIVGLEEGLGLSLPKVSHVPTKQKDSKSVGLLQLGTDASKEIRKDVATSQTDIRLEQTLSPLIRDITEPNSCTGLMKQEAENISGRLSTNVSEADPKPISRLTLTVGPEGGSEGVGDMSMYVPPGAVEEFVTLSSELHTSHCKFPPINSKEGYIFSPVLSLYPHGHQFKQPVLVKCPFNAVPGGWLLVLHRANCQEPSCTWEEIVVYNTDTGKLSTTDCSYDVSRGLLGITHFCDHCWFGKPISNSILGQKQLHCSVFGFGYSHNKNWKLEVIIHDRCDDIFKNIELEQLHKVPSRLRFDGPEVLTVGRHDDVTCTIKESPSWQSRELLMQLPSNDFWSVWFGNQSKISFEVTLKSGIANDDVRPMVMDISTSSEVTPVHLNILPPLESPAPVIPCLELLSDSKVFQAVVKYGVEQWYSIGLVMGLADPQIKSCTFDIPSPDSKLQALIMHRVLECGVKETEKCLLTACQKIPRPIIGAVLEHLERVGNGMSQQEGVKDDNSGAEDTVITIAGHTETN